MVSPAAASAAVLPDGNAGALGKVGGTAAAGGQAAGGEAAAQQQGGGFSFMPLLVGYMMGSMLSRGGGVFSQPMVRTPGGFSTPSGNQTFASNSGAGSASPRSMTSKMVVSAANLTVTACVTAVGATKIIVKNNPEPLDQAFAWYKS